MAIKDFHFENLPRPAQILIFIALVGCLASVYYIYYLKGLVDKHNSIQIEIKRLEFSVAKKAAIESKHKQFEKELARLQEQLENLQRFLPAEKETPAILKSIQQMATSSNMRIDKFVPQPLVPRAFYSDWPIHLELQGNYSGLGLFMEKISRATRIMNVDALIIKGIEQQNDASQTITATCTATTFVFRNELSATAPETKPKMANKVTKKEKKR
jgi:type IV pilus assembly protein PilO